jgi:hypothetical protein
MNNEIKVTSHVGRDVLQTAAFFNNAGLVVWEYLINGIEYRDSTDQRRPYVYVNLDQKKKMIQITDNGHGMDQSRINQFLTMHGEQIKDNRKIKRGKFGSGKSAAFGIADKLEVETVCNGRLNKFSLTKDQLNNSDGNSISPEIIHSDVSTPKEDGTLITITDVNVPIKKEEVIKQVERNMPQLMNYNPEIVVNDHICKRKEVDVVQIERFIPDDKILSELGEGIELEVRVSRVSLTEEESGVFISVGEGRLVGKEDFGLGSKEMGNNLQGFISVPSLDNEVDGISAYTQARDLKLNKNHKLVNLLVPFLGSSLEKVRKSLVKEKKERQESEEGRRLQRLGNEISDVLNKSYLNKQQELQRIRKGAIGDLAKKLTPDSPDEDSDDYSLIPGISLRAEEEEWHKVGEAKNNSTKKENKANKRLREDDEGSKAADKRPAKPRPQKKGGFQVECKHLGMSHGSRYHYLKEDVSIQINLDHESVSLAYLNAHQNIEDIHFKRLIYEIAFTAYILAVAQEITEVDEMKSGADLRFDMQELYDEVTSTAAKHLYA